MTSPSEATALLAHEHSTPIRTGTPLGASVESRRSAASTSTSRLDDRPTPSYGPLGTSSTSALGLSEPHPRHAHGHPATHLEPPHPQTHTRTPTHPHPAPRTPRRPRRILDAPRYSPYAPSSTITTPHAHNRSLSPLLTPRTPTSRRLSTASLLRPRSIAEPPDDDGRGVDRTRVLALCAVCTLSIGHHFTQYLLGPLKHRMHRELGSTNSQFSLLIASLNLNSTWMPLVAGILVARYGTGYASVAATGAVLLGQMILFAGRTTGHVVMMAMGLFIFGLGMTPLMVVQETLLARLSPGRHLGLSLALGLVSGKAASFISAFVSLPLAEWGGDSAPFAVALVLCAASFLINLLRLGFGWGEATTQQGKTTRVVKWDGVGRLGDVFWVFIVLNVLCGMIWSPFLHLSANIVQLRFNLSESKAAYNSSMLLAGAIVLYPITGYITDRWTPHSPRTTFMLLAVTSILTLWCYIYLSLPVSWTHTPWPGLLSWALGHGASTLLLVVLVPRILPAALVPLGLGMHKALEMAGATGMQTLAGLWLDFAARLSGDDEKEAGTSPAQEHAAHSLLVIFAAFNVLQLVCIGALWRFESVRRRQIARCHAPVEADEYERLPLGRDSIADVHAYADDDAHTHTDSDEHAHDDLEYPGYHSDSDSDSDRGADSDYYDDEDEKPEPQSGVARTDAERARGRKAFRACLALIASVWVLFGITAVRKL